MRGVARRETGAIGTKAETEREERGRRRERERRSSSRSRREEREREVVERGSRFVGFCKLANFVGKFRILVGMMQSSNDFLLNRFR